MNVHTSYGCRIFVEVILTITTENKSEGLVEIYQSHEDFEIKYKNSQKKKYSEGSNQMI